MLGEKLRQIALLIAFTVAPLGNAFGEAPPPRPAPSDKSTSITLPLPPPSSEQSTAADERGTQRTPLVVRVLPPLKSREEIAEEGEDRARRAANDHAVDETNRWQIALGVMQLIVFIGQLAVFIYQSLKLRQTVTAAADQSNKMNDYIAESARAATAMENVATSLSAQLEKTKEIFNQQKVFAAMQLRAHVLPEGGVIADGSTLTPKQNLSFIGHPGIAISIKIAAIHLHMRPSIGQTSTSAK
jgi:hypothetical protein